MGYKTREMVLSVELQSYYGRIHIFLLSIAMGNSKPMVFVSGLESQDQIIGTKAIYI